MLDDRLSAVAQAVRPGSRVADIGTDHAYLPVWLVQNGVCPSAIASDVRTGPLEAAHRTVAEAHMEDRISLRLGDGLQPLRPEEADDVVIAGMGGETIATILDAAGWPADPEKQWILQPMTHAENVRRWLGVHGYTLVSERLVIDGRHLYPVITARYTAAPATEPLFWYAGAFEPKEGRPYREEMARHLRRKAIGLYKSGDESAAADAERIAAQLETMG